MISKDVYVDLNLQNNKINNAKINNVAANPGSPVEGVPFYHEVEKVWKFWNGTEFRTLAVLEDIGSVGQFKGGFDASSGNPPTAATGDDISAGDFYRVTVAGTVTGIIGHDVLEVGDLVFANVNNASNASDFTGVNVNQDLTGFQRDIEVTGVSVPTGATGVDVNATGLTNITGYKILLASNNVDVTSFLLVTRDPGGGSINIRSNVAITVKVIFIGT